MNRSPKEWATMAGSSVASLPLRECSGVINEMLDDVGQQAAEIERLQNLAERLKQEAEGHAQEACTQRSTVHSIYQAIGAQKGDWNGAEPVIEAFGKLKQERDQLNATVVNLRGQLNNCVGHLNRASRWFRNDTDYQGAMEAANNAIYRTPAQNLGDHDAEVIERIISRIAHKQWSITVADGVDAVISDLYQYLDQLRASAEEVKSGSI